MLAIDEAGKIVPTKVVEEVQLRVLKDVDGKEHPDTDSGFGQNFYEYVLRRAELFANPQQGGLRRVPNDDPVRFIPVFPFASLAADQPLPSGVVPLRQSCTNCHRHDNRPVTTVSGNRRSRAPDYPFGKASIRSLHPRRLPSVIDSTEAKGHAGRVIEWKEGNEAFQRLSTLWNREASH
jgi:hypothetical protein